MSSGTRRASGSLALLLLAATGPGLAGGGGAAGASQDAGQAAAPEVEARPLDAWGAALEAAQADPDAREVWLELLARESLGFDRQVAANGWAFELAESGDLEGALRIQSILHERLDAEWTLTNLAVSLTRLGRLDETRERLNDFLGRQPRSLGSGRGLRVGRRDRFPGALGPRFGSNGQRPRGFSSGGRPATRGSLVPARMGPDLPPGLPVAPLVRLRAVLPETSVLTRVRQGTGFRCPKGPAGPASPMKKGGASTRDGGF
jgi:hypothetical protein